MVKISNAVNGNNSTTQSNVEGKKVLTASSNGNSHTGSTSRSNSATRRSNQNGDEKSGKINYTKLHKMFLRKQKKCYPFYIKSQFLHIIICSITSRHIFSQNDQGY